METKRRWFSVGLFTSLLLGVALALVSSAWQAGDALGEGWWKRTEPYLRRVMNVPRAVTLELKGFKPASTPEFQIVVLEARRDEEVRPFLFYASSDGSKIIVDQVYDLTRDPFAANRARISLDQVPSVGPASARVTIVEYSDYTCPWCQRFFLTLEKPLLKRYPEQVRLVYKQYPLVGLRAWSEEAAVAAACAFRQGNEAFWALHEQLFVHLDRLKEKGIFLQFATDLPLDPAKFQTCIEKRESLADVKQQVAEAESLGVAGTPTFFINGRPVPGLPSRERFFEIVDEELALAEAARRN